jgi:hypothetical protein
MTERCDRAALPVVYAEGADAYDEAWSPSRPSRPSRPCERGRPRRIVSDCSWDRVGRTGSVSCSHSSTAQRFTQHRRQGVRHARQVSRHAEDPIARSPTHPRDAATRCRSQREGRVGTPGSQLSRVHTRPVRARDAGPTSPRRDRRCTPLEALSEDLNRLWPAQTWLRGRDSNSQPSG